MKPYLLFAGREDATLKGVQSLVGDFDSFAEAFVALVDRQIACGWWHILDTQTGEVVERQHLKVHNGMIGFERSHWTVGQPTKGAAKEEPIVVPAPVEAAPEPKLPKIDSIEADLRSVLVNGIKSGHVNGKANGHANGAAADH